MSKRTSLDFFRNSIKSYLESLTITYYLIMKFSMLYEKEGYEYTQKEDLMSRKRVFVWVTLISLLLFVFAANQAIATEKTVILNVPACSS